jgi:hypothetical protein
MDLLDQVHVVLRDAGYATEPLGGMAQQALTFEDDIVLGFLCRFVDVASLLSGWSAAHKAILTRCAPQLRLSRDKAWNVYAVFLTSVPASPSEAHEINRIEDDFTATRKIARAGIGSSDDVQRSLLPLLPIRSITDVAVSDYSSKMRTRLSMLPAQAVDAILGSTSPEELARILMEHP